MKRTFISTACAILIMALSATSCTNEDVYPVKAQTNQEAYDELRSEIKELNQKHLKQNPPQSTVLLKEKWKKFFKWFAVIGSDALATFAFGSINVTAGASASICAAQNLNLINPNKKPAISINSTLDPNNPYGQLPSYSQFGTGADAGYLHNLIISDVYQQYGNRMFDLNTNDLFNAINTSAENNGAIPSRNQQEMNRIISTFQYAFDNSENLEQFSSYISERYPNYKNEIAIVSEVVDYMQYTDPEKNNEEYMTNAFTIVNNSPLPETSKISIRSGISVANASAQLWSAGGTLVGPEETAE